MTDKQNYFTYTDNTSDNNDKIMENLHKQIIDGVNVKDCKRRIGKDNYCRYYKRPCSENNYNCIWKKYLRKEQECGELKNTITNLENIRDEFSAKLDQLKTKNEELKKNLNEGCLQYLTLMTEQRVLLKTLAEIKEICNSIENIENINSLYDAKLSGMYLQANKILQKISECEVKNE